MRKKYSVTVAVLTAISLIPAGAVLERASAAREARWYQYRFDGRRQGFNPNETQITPANVGSLARRKVVRFPFSGPTPPVVFQDTLYMFALSLVDPDQPLLDETTIFALNAETGATNWTRTIDCKSGVPVGVPAISARYDLLLVTLAGACGTSAGDGSIYALDPATGSLEWVTVAGTSPGTPALLGMAAYIRNTDSEGRHIDSIDVPTGSTNWTFRPNNPLSRLGEPSIGAGVLYFRQKTGGVRMLTALDPSSGRRLWTKASATGAPSLGLGRAYVGCDRGICSYNQAGDLKWSFAQGNGKIAIANSTVYVACTGTSLCALDGKTGALLWSTVLGVRGKQVTSITVAGGIVFAGTAGSIEKVDAATGDYLGSFGPGTPRTGPVVANGRVYIVSKRRLFIYALS